MERYSRRREGCGFAEIIETDAMPFPPADNSDERTPTVRTLPFWKRPTFLMQLQKMTFRFLVLLVGAGLIWLPFGLMAQPNAKTAATSGKAAPTKGARLAPYEPLRGAYLGAAIDLSNLGEVEPGAGTVGPIADKMGEWVTEAGRDHAIFVNFTQFPHEDGSFPEWNKDPKGWIAPGDFSEAAAALNAAPLITLEPMLPMVFVNDWKPGSKTYEATKKFAQDAGKWGKPMFVRFAHEMNGSWYPWAEWADKNRNMKRDPGEDTGFTAAFYRQAYRNMASMFRRYAPNAALVWCPNSGLLGGERRDVFGPWYPGDDVVDWVGMDAYERGWTMPSPESRLWGGQFANNLTSDAADDPKTPQDESINFYKTYAEKKRKPMMLCETSATLSYRTDLAPGPRAALNHAWKAGYWNNNEYGWMEGVYGTSAYSRRVRPLTTPIDTMFPQLKALVWFQIGKKETIPVIKTVAGVSKTVWFDNVWTDYRIGGGAQEDKAASPAMARDEIELYRQLTAGPYFIGSIRR